jgi:hypothetical protein
MVGKVSLTEISNRSQNLPRCLDERREITEGGKGMETPFSGYGFNQAV